ncbi:cytochrome c-type biogenesis protein [Bartonella bacilliformis]|uniref:Cytochrome c-type biogenesis protein n=2 Tax=Bartonella bacilliformis TaxID=774 RepID=A1URZ8_BARBK|nr:cytochrome c-type biogenesis protein [Bartonella bacilliformis]ABM45203.1 cytochrome c-type biogenesis protein CycL [Bartonella bacilliformis KC583]AMG85589.1 cytochrome c-type biogenesis protein CcmH [Bartonella bacilliformis]KZM37890.1 cytochrome C biogenesis protein cycl [Bartonella bacilliformis]KZN21940.1 cytochrome C biogenesis protein cycl [Bartonella bacilliformis]QFZ90173.1 cytochrome c-type biogenesis protein CcmH [Bartonella bacilliformis]
MKKLFYRAVILFYVVIFSMRLGMAVELDEMLDDPVLELRARDISLHLRCPVCQNQSIDDSNASLARDLRILVRERLKAGDSDQQVIDFLVERYGAFILLKPPFNKATWFLWLSPLIILIIGISFIFFQIKYCKYKELIALNADEEKS